MASEALLVNGATLPTPDLVTAIQNLPKGVLLKSGEINVAFKLDDYNYEHALGDILSGLPTQQIDSVELLQYPEDILRLNDVWIERDFKREDIGILGHIDVDTKVIGLSLIHI